MRLLIKNLIPMLFLSSAVLVTMPNIAHAEVISTEVVIDYTKFTLVSSRRVTRAVSEFTLKATAQNKSGTVFNNVKASLSSVPGNITIIDGDLDFGTITADSSAISSDEFTLQINLRQAYSLADLVWLVNGDSPAPPPPPVDKPSAVGFFMSIDNNVIKGEVDNKSHKNWIEVLAWSSGLSNSGSTHMGGASGAGKANLQDIAVTKFLDASTTALLLASAKGTYFDEVKIDIIKSCGRNNYTQYALTLNDVIISSVSSGGSGGEDKLTENVTFNMRSLETVYTPVSSKCELEQPIYSFQSYD
jgi:type VI secretion system secreted protein Hcp